MWSDGRRRNRRGGGPSPFFVCLVGVVMVKHLDSQKHICFNGFHLVSNILKQHANPPPPLMKVRGTSDLNMNACTKISGVN